MGSKEAGMGLTSPNGRKSVEMVEARIEFWDAPSPVEEIPNLDDTLVALRVEVQPRSY